MCRFRPEVFGARGDDVAFDHSVRLPAPLDPLRCCDSGCVPVGS